MTVNDEFGQVYGGVNTHEDGINLAVISNLGHDANVVISP